VLGKISLLVVADSREGIEIKNKKYSHILPPKKEGNVSDKTGSYLSG